MTTLFYKSPYSHKPERLNLELKYINFTSYLNIKIIRDILRPDDLIDDLFFVCLKLFRVYGIFMLNFICRPLQTAWHIQDSTARSKQECEIPQTEVDTPDVCYNFVACILEDCDIMLWRPSLSSTEQQVAPWLNLFQEGKHIDYQLSSKPQFFFSLMYHIYRPSVNVNTMSLKIYFQFPTRCQNFTVLVR